MAIRNEKLDCIDLSFVEEKLVQEKLLNRKDAKTAKKEFKRFMKLITKYDFALAVTSKIVDEFWHQFILFTPQYRKFCEDIFGEFIDHQPNTELTPVPHEAVSNLFKAYKKEYGYVSKVWYQDLPTNVRLTLLEGHLPRELNFQWSGWPGRCK